MQSIFDYSPEVANALRNHQPVLALESTLITHGLPAPHNLDIALAAENIAREHDVTPATIAIINGRVKIGLTATDLDILINDHQVQKASKRDLPYIISKGLNAGTTVASTLYCAHQAGIRLFATGGIGGVHRGDAADISADLIELANTPIAVICAGAKAILDLPKTLEYLETYSVPVVGYQTDTLPGFYTASSTHRLHMRCNTPDELAALLQTHWRLGLNSGVLIANPIPAENEIPHSVIEPVIQQALQIAHQQEIVGKAITPFLLSYLAKATAGKSMQANIALIKNNVRLASNICQLITPKMKKMPQIVE